MRRFRILIVQALRTCIAKEQNRIISRAVCSMKGHFGDGRKESEVDGIDTHKSPRDNDPAAHCLLRILEIGYLLLRW